MRTLLQGFGVGLLGAIVMTPHFANALEGEDSYIPGYNLQSKVGNMLLASEIEQNYSVIDYDYQGVLTASNQLLESYFTKHHRDLATSIQFFEQLNAPYIYSGAIGEGRCQSAHCTKIQQDLPYRLDGLDCVTLVQDLLALNQSGNIAEFKQNLRQISYGAYDQSDTMSFLNRNNFTSSDFNRVNQASRVLKDVTSFGPFSNYVAHLPQKVIDHKSWFEIKVEPQNLKSNIRVLPQNEKSAPSIIAKFTNGYADGFDPITINNFPFIPKEALVKKTADGYQANEVLINKLITPSVVEFVREDSKWMIGDKPINEIIGSNILISHMGVLYKKRFKKGEIIYQAINCDYNQLGEKICTVKPVKCNKGSCEKVMLLAASNAYPNDYIYSKKVGEERYACTDNTKVPSGFIPVKNKLSGKPTTCNRTFSMPLEDYLASKQYGKYPYMESASLVGIHVEKIV
ncbi:N-acetylmuramoyl-L-alanine amidase-like domain-containing protein [Fangia hongkongensis]|uniref:N-acetylmuramoyl-L-alanine amidase-like domain-containing protein n=1 Tax=Fangia hongkongensis TaxID=270495 RepID=UPI00037AB919|nr:N-acetylmuramoyl-L-alanine amidase-like domain-containing protein [Fangia hongkongensis]MBK2124930.1 DUF1460 domain-containing protein [Fangia hongkongensis]